MSHCREVCSDLPMKNSIAPGLSFTSARRSLPCLYPAALCQTHGVRLPRPHLASELYSLLGLFWSHHEAASSPLRSNQKNRVRLLENALRFLIRRRGSRVMTVGTDGLQWKKMERNKRYLASVQDGAKRCVQPHQPRALSRENDESKEKTHQGRTGNRSRPTGKY